MMKNLPIIGVMGSGIEEHDTKSGPLGKWIAENNFHLLTGGGGGVMTSVSRAFTSVENRAGISIGILPKGKTGYPNPWVELPIQTHLPLSGEQGTSNESRNHINILSSTVIIALPGGKGTLSEVKLAQQYGKPIIGFMDDTSQLEGIPSEIDITQDFDRVVRFVMKNV